jgi:integrase/recombinase XerD
MGKGSIMRNRTPQPGDLCERLRGSSLALVLARFSDHLARLGYNPSTTHQYLSAAEHFARWLGRRKASHVLIERFVLRHLPICNCSLPAMRNINCVRAATNRLRELLQIDRPTLCEGFRVHPYARQLLVEYERHLREDRGLAASTIHFRLHNAAAMLTKFGVRHKRDLCVVTAAQVTGFITSRLRSRSRTGAAVTTSATRLFLRFLLMQGYLTRDLTGAVLSPAQWRLSGLPPTLGKNELEKLVATCDGDGASSVALRDRTILLCLVDLGLRASDVAALCVDGVDLVASTLTLYRPKRRRSSVLPMTHRLSQAIGAYLPARQSVTRNVGPDENCLFVKHRAPCGQPLRPGGIRGVVRRRACIAGLQDQITGTHVIRHSVASSLLQCGASIKQIADLLGHRSIDTTSIYAKVDIRALSSVAMPWPCSAESAGQEVAL